MACITETLQYIVTQDFNIPLPECILSAEPYNTEKNRPVQKATMTRLSMMRFSKKEKLLDKELATIFHV